MTILITGTSRGLGKYLAEYYSKENRVFGCSRSDVIGWENYDCFKIDVTNEDEVVDFVKSINEIDVLINNAGVASMNHFLLTPYDTVKRIFETNFYGSFLFSREVIKKMKNKGGRIVNISTIAVPLKIEGELIYASSKAAVEQMTKILAKEVAEYSITVNTVAPTPMNTDLIKGVSNEKLINIINRQAIKRMGTFDDVVNVIDFFISLRSEFITGQTIYLGGC